jgi:FADH2 O2-dependent halogenase
VHGWFDGFDRGPAATDDHIHVHVLPRARSWLWQIPLSDSLTSLGLVTRRADFARADEDPGAWFQRQLADQPELAARVARARVAHPFVREGNFSYAMTRLAGHGWLLVGDAGAFVDPLFSSGVGIAAESARRAADAIGQALRDGGPSSASFAAYEAEVRAGVERWREFISLFYRLPVQFLELLDAEDGRELLRPLLQGEVHDPVAGSALARMRTGVAAAADPAHRWHEDLLAAAGGARDGTA